MSTAVMLKNCVINNKTNISTIQPPKNPQITRILIIKTTHPLSNINKPSKPLKCKQPND